MTCSEKLNMVFSVAQKFKENLKCCMVSFHLHESQPCCGEMACVTQWSYEPSHARPPKTDRSQWRVLTKCGPLAEEMANFSSIIASRTLWTVKKMTKRYDIRRWAPPGTEVSNMLLRKSRGQLLIAPEKKKWLGQSGNDTQLWMCLVVKVKSNDVKNNIAKETGMLDPWNWTWSSRRWQEWTLTS